MYCFLIRTFLARVLFPYKEEDPVDHQEVLREKCSELVSCAKLQEMLDSCNERVGGRSNTTETCEEELFDFVHCVDHCVSWWLLGSDK